MIKIINKILNMLIGLVAISFGLLAKKKIKWFGIPLLIFSITIGGYFIYRGYGDTPVVFGEGTSAADEPSRSISTSNYGFCRTMTATAGYTNGIGTTTTGLFPLISTSTISTLSATSSGGRVEKLNDENNIPLDVVFVDDPTCYSPSTTTAIPHYFEKYASTTGEFVAHIGTSDISSTTDKVITMYYGNSSATDNLNSPGQTYATSSPLNILGHWDLSVPGTATTTVPDFTDSTYNNNHLTSTFMDNADLVTAQIDGGLDFDGTNDKLRKDSLVDSPAANAPMSFSFWYKVVTNPTGTQQFVGIQTTSPLGSSVQSQFRSSALGVGKWGGAMLVSATPPTAGIWHHFVYTFDGTTHKLFFDKVIQATSTTAPQTGTPNQINIGSYSGNSEFFKGQVDNVRIYKQAITESDLATIYNMERDSTTFWAFGSEETAPSGASVVPDYNRKLFTN